MHGVAKWWKTRIPNEFECRCWCCDRGIDDVNGISLTDTIRQRNDSEYLEVQVCRRCWSQIPLSNRLWIQGAMRTRNQGGLSLSEVMAEFAKLIADTQREAKNTRKFDGQFSEN